MFFSLPPLKFVSGYAYDTSNLIKGWFPLGVNRRRSVKNSLFLYLALCAQRALLSGPYLDISKSFTYEPFKCFHFTKK